MTTHMARLLFDRRGDVGRLDYVTACPADWAPTPNRCHENAAAWVDRFPSWEVVRGWLLVAEDEVMGTMFDAHSVVRDENGNLWDVTQGEVHRFLVHPGDDEEFVERVDAGPWVRLSYIPGM
ncbi:hypothetical protein LJR034_008707 [Caballeronia sp. LjRoot34]|uniref:hypothetical protein n=1 Tax=Caballeronia sp. LjRoot34 TaxID=3342325 RepID=UPI003ECD421F